MVFDLLRKGRGTREDDLEKQRTAAILDAALLQRARLHVRFDRETSNLRGVTASLLAVDASTLTLELDGLANLKDRFLGQSLDCFFRIVERGNKHREIFYSFSATILRVGQIPEGGVRAIVAAPASLQATQRRKSLRLKPDLQKFSHLAVWKYDAAGFDIAKPTVSHGHFKQSQAVLDNLSGGGLRLTVRRSLVKEQNLAPSKGDRFIVFFDFAEEIPKLRREYWLVAKVNNVRPEPVSGDMTLGMEFVANGCRHPETGKVEWGKVCDNVIDDMAQRIYHWHLSLYRDKGLAG